MKYGNFGKAGIVILTHVTLLKVQNSNEIYTDSPFPDLDEDGAIFNNNAMLGVYHQIRYYILANCGKSYDRRKVLKDLKDLLKPAHDQWLKYYLADGCYRKWSKLIEDTLQNFSVIVEQLPLEDLK